VRQPQHPDEKRSAHRGLRDRGARSRARDSPAEAVDEEHDEDHVQPVRRHFDHERRAEVRDAAKVALPAEYEKRGRETEDRDSEIGDRVLGGLSVPAHERNELLGGQRDPNCHRAPEAERQPEGLRAEPVSRLPRAGSRCARHLRGRPVGEEVEHREDAAEQEPGDPERRQLLRPQMADDRRIREREQRLGRERAEGEHSQPENLPVVRRASKRSGQRHAGIVWRRSIATRYVRT
jgi:hypothetical protein